MQQILPFHLERVYLGINVFKKQACYYWEWGLDATEKISKINSGNLYVLPMIVDATYIVTLNPPCL